MSDLGKSRQVAALARKAWSFQKRQTFTNCCCIAACPLVMVAIAGILGNLISTLIQRTSTISEFLYCSNTPNSNSLNIPYWTTDSTEFPSFSPDASKYPTSTQNAPLRPCSWWFGENYPYGSLVYDKDPGVTGTKIRDATYLYQPSGGWFANVLNFTNPLVNASTQLIFSRYNQYSWFVVGYDSSVSSTALGTKDKQAEVGLSLLLLPSETQFVSPLTNPSTGLLGTIPSRYSFSYDNLTFTRVPFYKIDSSFNGDGIDDYISGLLRQLILDIAQLDKSALFGTNQTEKNKVYQKASTFTAKIPHGGIYFTKIDHSNKKYSFNFHVGNDQRIRSIQSWAGSGTRMLYQFVNLANGILRNSNVNGLGNAQITQGLRILPNINNNKLKINIGGPIGVILFPFGVSFLLPIFAIVLIQEKEQRILMMMKMNGMKAWTYYVSHYVTFTILYWLSMIVFLVSGRLFQLTLFTQTEPATLFVMLFIWGNNLIALAFFFSAFFSRSRFALVVVFLIVLCSVIISLALLQIFSVQKIPNEFFIWPPFAFYRALGKLNQATYATNAIPYALKYIVPGDEVFTCMIYMIVEIPIFLILAFYFEMVFPSEFGVRLPWHFPITEPLKWYRERQLAKIHGTNENREAEMALAIQVDETETKFEDADVKEERQRVVNGSFPGDEFPLVVKNMRKVYPGRGGQGPKLAVKDVTFACEKGLTFGLLGPNGFSD